MIFFSEGEKNNKYFTHFIQHKLNNLYNIVKHSTNIF